MMFSGATLRQDMLIMIGVLIAVWFVKVVVLFVYMTYYRRRHPTLGAEGDPANPAAPPKSTSTPPEVIAALPVCAYRDLATAGGSSSSDSSGGGKISSGQDATGQQQQEQQEHQCRKCQRSDSDHLAWKPTGMDEVQSCGVQQQQQQQQAAAAAVDTPSGKVASLFRVRLSLDSALTLVGRKHQRTNSSTGPTVAAAAGGASLAPAADLSAAAAAAAAAVSAAPAGQEEEEAETCAICFCEYEGSDLVKHLPQCGHFYHTDCIDTWLSRGTTCPLCKRAVWEEEEQQAQETPQVEQQQQPQQQGDAVVVTVDGVAAEVGPSHVIVTVPGQPARV